MPYGESVTGIQVGGVEMAGILEGDNLGQKKNTLRSNQALLQINFCMLFDFFFSWKMQNA